MPDRIVETKRKDASKRSGKSRDPLDIQIGLRIRQRRKDYGISQARLGAALGITQQQIQRYESGEGSIRTAMLYRLAHQLGVSVTYLID